MTELARGKVADRPWGLTLGALGVRRLTGVLRLTSESKLFSIRFENGAVIDATSSLISDSAARVAMTCQLINPNQFGEAVRLLALMPDRDEYEVVAEVAGLTTAQIDKLRRRVIAQRAARTLSIPDGEFVVTSASTTDPAFSLDIRPLIYLGALVHMPEARMDVELAALGARFQLRPDAAAELPAYGFTDAELKVVTALEAGASMPELEKACPDLDRRTICAVVYVLVSGLACRAVEVAPSIATPRVDTRRVPSKIDPNTSFNVQPVRHARPAEPPVETKPNKPAMAPMRLRITVDTVDPPIVERQAVRKKTPSVGGERPLAVVERHRSRPTGEAAPLAPKPTPTSEPTELPASPFDEMDLARKSDRRPAAQPPSEPAIEPLADSPFDDIDLARRSQEMQAVPPVDESDTSEAPASDATASDASEAAADLLEIPIEVKPKRRTASMWAQAPFDADQIELLAHQAEAAAPAAGHQRSRTRTEQLLVFAAIPREPSSRNMPAQRPPEADDIPLLDDSLLEPVPDEPGDPDDPSSPRRTRWPRARTESAWLPLDLRRPAGRDDPDRS